MSYAGVGGLGYLCRQKYSLIILCNMPDRLLSPKQVADGLNVSVWTVYRLVRKGDLVAVRVGRLLRIPESSLEAFLDLRRVRTL